MVPGKRNSRLSLCTAMGGLSLLGVEGGGGGEGSFLLSSPGLVGKGGERISEGSREDEEEDGGGGGETGGEPSQLPQLDASSISFLVPPTHPPTHPLSPSSSFMDVLDSSLLSLGRPSTTHPPTLSLLPLPPTRGIEKIAGELTTACLEFLPVHVLTDKVNPPTHQAYSTSFKPAFSSSIHPPNP